ncbi:hypothetical protein UlMin_026466 [Ulmus minor]
MRRTRSLDVVSIDLDIDRTLRRLRRERKEIDLHEVPVMGEEGGGDAVPNRAIKDYSIPSMRNDITNFLQQDHESFGGAFLNKTPEDGYELMEVMASNNFLKPSDRNSQKRTAGVHDIDAFNKLAAQVALLNNNFKSLNVSSISNVVCDFCAGNHSNMECQFRSQAQENSPNQNQGASIRNLEHQVGEISKLLTERAQGTFPSNTEKNPREEAKAITLRSGKELEKSKEASKQAIEEDTSVSKDQPTTTIIEQPLPKPSSNAVPFPQRLRKQNLDKQFSKFIDIFKSLHINLHFVDMLEKMPKYAKFLKEVLSNKRRLEVNEKVMLTEEYPGSFTIPCTIGDFEFDKVLCDLGASNNLMPLSIFRKLGLGEVKPTTVSLQLADRSIKHPRGIIEDVLVKVDKFIFPADFIVLDMEEDREVPLILGRPFLATGRTLIDVHQGKLILRVQDE